VVWIFTASQGGKASEKKALRSIRDEGKRVLGVLNKADQLSADERTEVVDFISTELGELVHSAPAGGAASPGQARLVETIVPVSAREAMVDHATGNWPALIGALEERFFQQARALKRDACARVLRGVIAQAQATLEAGRTQESAAVTAAHAGRDELDASARAFADQAVVAERQRAVRANGAALSACVSRGPRSRTTAPAAVLVAHGDRGGSRVLARAVVLGLRVRDRRRQEARRGGSREA